MLPNTLNVFKSASKTQELIAVLATTSWSKIFLKAAGLDALLPGVCFEEGFDVNTVSAASRSVPQLQKLSRCWELYLVPSEIGLLWFVVLRLGLLLRRIFLVCSLHAVAMANSASATSSVASNVGSTFSCKHAMARSQESLTPPIWNGRVDAFLDTTRFQSTSTQPAGLP